MECYQRGILTKEDTGGLALEWGDGEILNTLIDMIANREGFGDFLADGALAASRKLGRDSEQYVVHVRGLEVAMHDPRAMDRMLDNYPVNPTGGDHTGGAHHRTSIRNTIGVCQFLAYDDTMTLDILNAVTGWGMTEDELNTVFERGIAMAKLFNLRCGFTGRRRPAAGPLPGAAQDRTVRGQAADRGGCPQGGDRLLRLARLGRADRHPEDGDAGEARHRGVRHRVGF